ncbi:MAG TPA: hypothetical protein VEA38_24220 [Terriglobales bacterium]|nr:hypothetical protein [Terriglobales bacterium]
MGHVGRPIIDPRAGAYCDVTLDNGDKLIVNHDKGGFKGGRLTIEKKKWMGLGSDSIFACDLDSADGKAALARLTAGLTADTVAATPLGAFANYIKDAASADDVKTKCATLLRGG